MFHAEVQKMPATRFGGNFDQQWKKKAQKEKKVEINGNFRLPGEIFISTKRNKLIET